MKIRLLFYLFFISTVLFFAFQAIPLPSTDASKISKLLEKKDNFIAQQQYNLAIDKLLNAKEIYAENQQWTAVVKCYTEAASLAEEQYDYNKKKKYAQLGTTLANKYLSIDDKVTIAAMQQLGEAYYGLEELDSTIVIFQQLTSLYDKHKNWEDKGWAIYIIALVYFDREDYKKAEQYLLEVKELAQTHHLEEEFFAALEEFLSVLYFQTIGDVDKAIHTTNQALKYCLSKSPEEAIDSSSVINYYNNLGIFYDAKSDFSRSAFYYKNSIELAKKLQVNHTESLLNYTKALRNLRNNVLAINTLKKALKHNQSQPKGEEEAIIYHSICLELANNYQILGQIDSALYFIKQYANSSSKSKNKFEALEAASIYHHLGNNELAIAELNKIEVKDSNKNLAALHIKIKKSIILGQIYYTKKDFDTALKHYQKALNINAPATKNLPDLYTIPSNTEACSMNHFMTTLKLKAQALKAINTPKSLKAAFDTNQLAIEWAEKLRQNFTFKASKVNLNKNQKELYQNVIEIAYELYNSTNDPIYLKEAFAVTEKQKGILLLESLIDQKGKQYYNVPQNLLEREQDLKSDIAFYKQKMLNAKQYEKTERYKLYENYYTTYNLALGNLKDTLQNYYKTYFTTEYQTAIASVTDIQERLLEPEQALIEYFATDSSYYVFVIEKNNQHFLKLSKGAKETATLLQLQTALRSIDAAKKDGLQAFKDFTSLAHQGYQQTLEPLIQVCATTTKKLIIIPDDGINYLPFEALLNEAITSEKVDFLRLPYLLHQYQFHYGYSSTLLLENQQQHKELEGNDEILAYAPPYRSNEAMALRGGLAELRGETAQLAGTSKEIQAIAQHFDGSFDFGPTATKANFQEQAKDYGILHLAMHGQPSLTQPDYAHLVFSNVTNESNTDNLLHHYEITALETQAQLAVLSACETGVGKELAGEGIMSLGRAFMYAGVPSIVMSLWKMNDQSTSELMPFFYEHLASGKRKDKALHQAKVDYLNNASSLKAHPFYWAGFVGNGAVEPIKETAKFNWIWWLVGTSFLLIFLGFIWKRKN